MKKKTFILTAAVIFFIVGVLHLIRGLYGISLILGDYVIPIWISYVAFAIAAYLWHQSGKLK